jgi:hypothetical protein
MPTTKSAYRTALRRRVHEVSQLAKENLLEAQLTYKRAHDAFVKERNMAIKDGDWVIVNKMVLERGLSPKLAM